MPNNGEQKDTEHQDDKTIADDTLLYRRVMNQPNPPARQIVWDDNNNCWRPSSVAFTDHRNGSSMSVALGDTLQEEGLEPASVLDGHEGFCLVSFPANIPRSLGQGIMRKPVEGDPAHGEVFGNKTKPVRRALAKKSEWHIPPNQPKPN